ncbi:AIR synthase family protein [Salinirubellus salinus]|uniref:AIR synthase family protein n=1 Tax=Salinirubellus salinus TaxID=1364945 RepID=A0A9E7R623_9EURY|nr:AIR synthase family protein [Salinirubellus salinus]UWM56242.1 AIR synthase family protein [Salinirubellus salinus]
MSDPTPDPEPAPALGKLDRAFLERHVYPNLGATRSDVLVGPRHGVDFGVLEVGGECVVTATDPLSILPALGLERAGRLALDICLTDVAVSGVGPTHVAVALTLPPEMTDDEVARVWRGMADHAESLGVSVVTGHTGRYSGVASSWVGAATGFGVGDPADVVRPDGARPGDALVVSTGPAAEVAGLFATLFGDRLDLPAAVLATARERVDDIAAVADARAAFAAGEVTAMHDATEGGVAGGLVEMARGAGVRFDVDRSAVPMAPGVDAVCTAVDVDPWHVTSCGTLLLSAAPADAEAVVAALEDRGTPAAVVGEVSAGEGVYVDGEHVEHPDVDPSWAVYRALSEE